MAIHFFVEDIHFTLPDPQLLATWLREVALLEGKKIDALNYIFCDDACLHRLNVRYLSHDTFTDVITFDFSDPATSTGMLGDIYSSIPRIQENAIAFDVPFWEELARVVVHGLLHLLGYADNTPAAKAIMRDKENSALAMPLVHRFFSCCASKPALI